MRDRRFGDLHTTTLGAIRRADPAPHERKVRPYRHTRWTRWGLPSPLTSVPMIQVSSGIIACTSSASPAAHDDDHADAHVEHAVQLVGVDAGGELGDQFEQRAARPGAELDLGVDAVGQDAWQVLRQPAAGDVGERLDPARVDRRARARAGTSGAASSSDSPSELLEARRRDVHRHPVEQLAQEREAVGVRSARCDADQHVAGGDVVAGQQLACARRCRPACRRCRTRRARRRPASRPSRRRAARSRRPRTPRPCRRRPRRRGRRRARWRRCSRGRTSVAPTARARRRCSG